MIFDVDRGKIIVFIVIMVVFFEFFFFVGVIFIVVVNLFIQDIWNCFNVGRVFVFDFE